MSAGKMMCFDLIFYFKKKKKSAHIGPIQVMFQTESKIYIYIYCPWTCVQPRPQPHSASMRVGLGCAGQIGAPMLTRFIDNKIELYIKNSSIQILPSVGTIVIFG